MAARNDCAIVDLRSPVPFSPRTRQSCQGEAFQRFPDPHPATGFRHQPLGRPPDLPVLERGLPISVDGFGIACLQPASMIVVRFLQGTPLDKTAPGAHRHSKDLGNGARRLGPAGPDCTRANPARDEDPAPDRNPLLQHRFCLRDKIPAKPSGQPPQLCLFPPHQGCPDSSVGRAAD